MCVRVRACVRVSVCLCACLCIHLVGSGMVDHNGRLTTTARLTTNAFDRHGVFCGSFDRV